MWWTVLAVANATTEYVDCATSTDLAALLADATTDVILLEGGCSYALSDTVNKTLGISTDPTSPDVAVLVPGGATNTTILSVTGGSLTLAHVELDGQGTHGLIHLGVAELILDDVTARGGKTTNGAALYTNGGSATITDSTFTDNESTQAGGHIHATGSATVGISNTTFTRGIAGTSGGGIFTGPSAAVDLVNVIASEHSATNGGFLFTSAATIRGLDSSLHTADANGGAIHTNGDLSICDSRLSDGTATSGGAIYANGATVTIGLDANGYVCAPTYGPIQGVAFTAHAATNGGSLYALTTTLTMQGSTFDGGSASTNGGHLWLSNAPTTISSTSFHDGSATVGGCVQAVGNDPLSVSGSTFEACVASTNGGAIAAGVATSLTAVTLTDTSAGQQGGALHLTQNKVYTLDTVAITNSYAANEGGGIYMNGTADSSLTNISVAQSASAVGGALALRSLTATIDPFVVTEGFASDGAAIFVAGASTVTLRRGLMCDNNGASGTLALNDTAGSPHVIASQLAFVHNTTNRGGAIHIDSNTQLTATDLHLIGNVAFEGAGLFAGLPSVTDVSNAVIANNEALLPQSAAVIGLTTNYPSYWSNWPLNNLTFEPDAVEQDPGFIEAACTWESLRDVSEDRQAGVFSPFNTVPPMDTWLSGDPLRDDDLDLIPWVNDCDDNDIHRNYLQPEQCTGVDDDCDGLIDDDDDSLTGAKIWYLDGDGDGLGDPLFSTTACTAPEGYVADLDCDDTTALEPHLVYVDDDLDSSGTGDAVGLECGAPAPGFSIDNLDCDDDDSTVTVPVPHYADLDADGYGGQAIGALCPSASANTVQSAGDCDDSRSDVSPQGIELCDGVDQNCNGEVDEGVGFETYTDEDGDGFGTGPAVLQCDLTGRALNADDCRDDDADLTLVCPGKALNGRSCAHATLSPGALGTLFRRR